MHSLLILATLLAIFSASINCATNSYKNVAYYTNWAIYGRNFHPQDLNANALTHVLYAFANINPDSGEVYLSDTWSDIGKHYSTDSWNEDGLNVYGCVKQLFLQKKRNRKLKTLLSIGGWTFSSNFAQPASTVVGRCRFASSAVQLLKDLGFDGLDVDWEFPQNEAQAADLVSLLAETRKQLDVYAEQHSLTQRLLLTVAAPAGPANYNILKLAAMDKYLDFWNLMTYDYSNAKDGVASHNSNWNESSTNPSSTPYSSNQAIFDYIAAGVPTQKLVIGMPLYGRSFANTDGPGTPFSGVGNGTWEPGIYDYKDLPLLGDKVSIDLATGAGWTYDPARRFMVSLDTPITTLMKTRYIKAWGLGGAMWWELSGDKTGGDSLVSTFFESVRDSGSLEQSDNLLQYPDSAYKNLRANMLDE